MDPMRFDRLSKLFAARRLSRRRALQQLGTGGLAASLLGATGLPVAAQGTPAAVATPSVAQGTPVPAATPGAVVGGAKPTTFMFVQSFTTGSLAPQANTTGLYTLTLRRGIDQTVYFSDRPDRIFGLTETGQFLKGLGFAATNPPNAALVAHQGPGRAELIVLELQNPHYDAAHEVLTYDVKILQDTRHTPFHYNETPVTQIGRGRTYGSSALFIDDCADGEYYCVIKGSGCNGTGGYLKMGCCYDWASVSCKPCGDLNSTCNSLHDWCNGNCQACRDPGCGNP